MKYVVVDENRTTLLPTSILCKVLSVSRSGFYEWLARLANPSPAKQEQQKLEANVIRVHFESRRIYGYRKVHSVLAAEGTEISDKKVYDIMAKNNLRSKTRKAYKPRTTDSNHRNKVSPRVFKIESTEPKNPNEVWAGDITYVATKEGWLYLSIFIDLFSRMVVGWAIADHMRVELVRESLTMAIKNREVAPGLIVHSDQGVQYTAGDYRSLIEILKFIQSMSRRGNCYDNAYVESFFSQMKKELSTKVFETKKQAIEEIIDFITNWYNTKRVHSSIGYVSPRDFETKHEALAS
jgi:transposase InsO family protein